MSEKINYKELLAYFEDGRYIINEKEGWVVLIKNLVDVIDKDTIVFDEFAKEKMWPNLVLKIRDRNEAIKWIEDTFNGSSTFK